VRPDTDRVAVERFGGGNVRLQWPRLRAHRGLQLVEYALYVREALGAVSDVSKLKRACGGAQNLCLQKRLLNWFPSLLKRAWLEAFPFCADLAFFTKKPRLLGSGTSKKPPQVLADGSELCERRLAAVLQGRGAGGQYI